jgi:hypothetical protein
MKTKKIKKTLAAALSFIVTISSMSTAISSYAEEYIFDIDDYFDYEDEFDGVEGTYQNITWSIDSDGVLTISGEGDMPEIIDEDTGEILEELYDENIEDNTEISDDTDDTDDSSETLWIDYTDYVTEIIVEDGITSISSYAFAGFMSASKATVASTVKKIGDGAFFLDLNLAKVTLSEGVEEIGIASFALTGLKAVKLPKSLDWVHTYAFAWDDDLTDYTILDNGAYFGPYSIGYTADLDGNDVVSDDVVINGYENSSAYEYALENEITFENLGTAKAENYLPDLYKLKNSGNCGDDITWTLEDGVLTLTGEGDMPEFSLVDEELPEWYGETADAVTSIVIGDGITSISESAFETCVNATELTLGSDITEIGDYAFKGTSLKEVVLPDSVVSIGARAFVIPTLESLTAGSTVEYITYNAISGSDDLTIIGEYGTLAEIYAQERGYNFKSLSGTDGTPTSELLSAGYNNENWGFENSYEGFPVASETSSYYISDNDLMQLVLNLSNVEYFCYGITDIQYQEWGGSCYGMAILLALVHNGDVDLASFGQDVSSVSELVNTNELESIINYYFVLQSTDGKIQEMIKSFTKDDTAKITDIVSQVEEASANDEYKIIGIWGDGWGHEIVATGVVDGSWQIGTTTYDKCILIADPNFSDFNLLTCIYCNTTDGSWTIPMYFEPDEERMIDISDNSTLNELGMFGKNTERQALIGNYFDTITLTSESANDYINYVSDGKSVRLSEDTADYSEESTDEDFIGITYSTKSYYLENKNNYSYEFISDGSALLSGQVYFNGIEAEGYASYNTNKLSVANNKITFKFGDFSTVDTSEIYNEDGDNETTDLTTPYGMSFVVNDEYTSIPFGSVEVYGNSYSDSVSLEREENGYILTADNLSSLSISASSLVKDTENVLFYQNDYYYSGEYADISEDAESVFITYDEANDAIALYEDLDNNGTYETKVDYDDTYDDALIIEDENGNSYYLYDDDEDGVIDRVVNITENDEPVISDDFDMEIRYENGKYAIYADIDGDGKFEEFIGYAENKAVASSDKATTETKKSLGDINGDGKVNSSDAVEILKDYAQSILSGKSSLDKDIADCNSDGKINSVDAVLVLRYFAQTIINSKVGSFADFVK